MSTDRRRGVLTWLLAGALAVVVAGLVTGDLIVFLNARTPPAAAATAASSSIPDTPRASVATADATGLTAWASRVAAATGIPARALQAYGQAELTLANAEPACRLSWNTLAGIATVESRNGSYGGAALDQNGTETRPIIGVPLDGTDGNRMVPDTDHGTLDGDPVHDRAVGPFQFLPQTWRAYAPPGANPQNIDAAALAAGRYLCSGGRDLSTGRDWWAAVRSYNNSLSYAREVFADTDSYAAATASSR